MARKVNKRFLTLFSIIVLGGIVAGLVIKYPIMGAMRSERAKKQLVEADRLMVEADKEQTAQGKRDKLENAVRNYIAAIQADSKNDSLYIKLGDAYTKLTLYDIYQYIRVARQQWERALEINPSNITALRRLMESYAQETQIRPQAQFFSQLEEKATAVHKLDPKDRRAHALRYMAPLHQWLANIETPQTKIETAVQELTALVQADPSNHDNAEPVFFLAQARARRGVEALRAGNRDREAQEAFTQSISTFNDVLKTQDGNAAMHYRFYGLVEFLRKEDRERDRTQRYTQIMQKELERAKELVKPDDKDFVPIYLQAHQFAVELRDARAAENILLEAQKVKPDDQRVRLALARFWKYDPKKRPVAISLLQLPITNIGFEGVQAQLRLGLEIQTNVELTNMLIDDLAQARDLSKDERQKRVADIERYYQKAADKAGDSSAVLKVRGKIELLKGGNDAPIRAIKAFEKAQNQFRIERMGQEDLDLCVLLARAYFASGQYGQAKQQLLKFMDRSTEYVPVRMMLAQILVAENDVAQAKGHVDYLRAQAPDDPDVLKLSIAVSDPIKERPQIKEYLSRLPEGSRPERLIKAQVAAIAPCNDPDEAIRLYKSILVADPADFEAVNALRELLVSKGKKDDAVAVLQAAIQAKPADKRFPLMVDQIKGADPKAQAQAMRKLIEEMFANDPFGRELRLYEFEMIQSNGEDGPAHRAAALKHVLAAEQLKPDDGRVMDLLFQYYVTDQNWEKVNSYITRLAEKNWDQAGGLIYKFRIAMVRNDTDAAVTHARELTTRYGEFARSWVFLGQALQAKGLYDQAVPNYQIALDKQTENPDALAGIIACLYQQNRPAEVFRYIEQAVKAHPNNNYFREQWKAWQLNWGKPTEVLDLAKADVDAKPDDVNRWIALARVQYAAARKRDKDSAKYVADAKATLMEAIKKFPAERMSWAILADIADFTKDLAWGETILKDMAGRPEYKDSADPLMLLSDLYLKAGKSEQAEATMRKAVDQFKDNMDVRRRLAAYYTTQRKYDDALKLLDPSSPDKLTRQQIVEILMLAGKYQDAENLLKGLIAGNPKDAQLHALLGVVLVNQNRRTQAMESLDASLNLDARNQAALFSRGQIRLKDSPPNPDAAIVDLRQLRDLNPRHVEARISLAECYRLKGQPETAARELEDALRLAPGRDDVRVNLCGIYAGLKPPQWTDVEKLLKQAIEQDPKRPLWRRMEAKMLSSRGQHDRAIVSIRDAIVLASSDQERGDIARDYFDILEASKNWRQLVAECDQAFKTSSQATKEAWWIYVKRATARRYLDQKTEAMADFQKAFEIAQEQGNPDVLYGIVERIGQHMGKEASIDRVTALVTASKGVEAARWKVILAYLHLSNENVKKAQELVEEARLEEPNMGPRDLQTTLAIAGTVYMHAGDFNAARGVYEKLLENKPEDLAALNNLACLYAEHTAPPNLPKALQLSTRAYDVMNRKNSVEPNILDTHGWVNVLTGGAELDKGIDLLQTSIKLGEIPEAHYHLGEAFLRKKLAGEAKRSFSRAEELLLERQEKGIKLDLQLKEKVQQGLLQAEKLLSEARTTP